MKGVREGSGESRESRESRDTVGTQEGPGRDTGGTCWALGETLEGRGREAGRQGSREQEAGRLILTSYIVPGDYETR